MKKFVLILLIFSFPLFQNCSPFNSSDEFQAQSLSGLESLTCQANDPRIPKVSPLRRIGKVELKYMLEDLFEKYMNQNQLKNLLDAIASDLENIPDDHVDRGANVADFRVSKNHVESLFLLSESIVDHLSTQNQVMNNLIGSCYSNPDENCKENFLKNFGLRAFRRPLSPEDIAHFLGVMDGHSNPFKNALVAILNSPAFYYHIQAGDSASSTDNAVISLGPYERASKLSFFFLRSLPDDELLESARSGEIMTPLGVSKQVERLIKDPLVRKRLTRSFTDEWLHIEATSDLNTNIQEVQARLQDIDPNIEGDDLKNSLIAEVYDFMDYLIWEQQANFNQLMTSNLVFPRNQALANIYGTDQWDGSYDLAKLVRAPQGQRAGVLTQAHFLYTGSAGTRPIMRGVHVYEDFLCGDLSLPPNNDTPEGVMITDDMTDQEYVRAITEKEGSSCVGCHKNIINPIGFSFDNFDAFGKFRTQERVFQPEESPMAGQVLTTKPISTYAEINLTDRLEGQFESVVDIAHHLGKSAQANACFTTKLWNFAQKQEAKLGTDPCAVNSVYAKVSSSESSIIEAFKEIALQPEFMKRTLQ